MKIAMIVKKLNIKGGTQRQALSLARELKKGGHEVVLHTLVFSPENCYPELLSEFRVVYLTPSKYAETYELGFPWNIFSALAETKKENLDAKALQEMMDSDYDVLNPHDQISYKTAYYYKKNIKEIPSVWNMNDLPLRTWGYLRSKGCDDNFRQPLIKRVGYKIFDLYEKYAFLRHQDRIIVVDHFNAILVKKFLRMKAETIRSGPDFEHFPLEEKTAAPRERKIKILTSGIFMIHRRFEDTIQALPILSSRGIDASLTIIGDTECDKKYSEKIKKLVSNLKLENKVRILGRVSEENLIKEYHDNDVYIFQHHLQSDGLSPFEAAACGLPLILSKTAGCHEVMTDRENALLIEPKDPNGIADKIETLCTNEKLYLKLAKNGNNFVRSNFSWPKYAQGVLNIIKEAIAENRQKGNL